MRVVEILRKVAAAKGGVATIVLETPDGDIPCTAANAELIERLWVAFHSRVDGRYETSLEEREDVGEFLCSRASNPIQPKVDARLIQGPGMNAPLTIETLISEAALFSLAESSHAEPALFGVTDGKAIGTYLEHKFIAHLMDGYSFAGGNSASGIDIPGVNVDIKVTSVRQPQSSSPFRSARQKIYGLGYGLIIFVYDKTDDSSARTGRLDIQHTIFVSQERTADYQMTRGLLEILDRDGNEEDLVAFMRDKNLPVDDIEAANIAKQLLVQRPEQGYLTISNALQWRLQYGRVIQQAGLVSGLHRIG